METKDDIKNTAKYMDDSLLHKDDSDEGGSGDEEVQKKKSTAQKRPRKNSEGSGGDSLSPQELEPLLPEKDSPGALRRKSLMSSRSMSLSSSQSLQSPSPWTSLLNEPEVDLN